jgi:hypothetical protein
MQFDVGAGAGEARGRDISPIVLGCAGFGEFVVRVLVLDMRLGVEKYPLALLFGSGE